MEMNSKWPKEFPELTAEQLVISNDFMRHWHEVLAGSKRFQIVETFNHMYSVKHSPDAFLTTLEVGAGLGEHLAYEKLTQKQKENYVALELREVMAEKILQRFPDVKVCVADCQKTLPYEDDYFDRIIAVHVLEHLPNLPATIKELYRVCNKKGHLSVVIPCEGGALYGLARKLSAQRIFEKRYKQSYKWYIEREHINKPDVIKEELSRYFHIKHTRYFPFFIPVVGANLCIGMTLEPIENALS